MSGWVLAGGASQVGGSETAAVTGVLGSSSLGLPNGGGALAPPVCVNVPNPTVEFFTRSDDPGASVTVYAVFQRKNGKGLVERVGNVPASSDWEPSGPLTINPPQADKNGNLLIALAFQASGGFVQVDDVYVDPWSRCC